MPRGAPPHGWMGYIYPTPRGFAVHYARMNTPATVVQMLRRVRRIRQRIRKYPPAEGQRRREADPEYRRVMGMVERAAVRQGYPEEFVRRFKIS